MALGNWILNNVPGARTVNSAVDRGTQWVSETTSQAVDSAAHVGHDVVQLSREALSGENIAHAAELANPMRMMGRATQAGGQALQWVGQQADNGAQWLDRNAHAQGTGTRVAMGAASGLLGFAGSVTGGVGSLAEWSGRAQQGDRQALQTGVDTVRSVGEGLAYIDGRAREGVGNLVHGAGEALDSNLLRQAGSGYASLGRAEQGLASEGTRRTLDNVPTAVGQLVDDRRREYSENGAFAITRDVTRVGAEVGTLFLGPAALGRAGATGARGAEVVGDVARATEAGTTAARAAEAGTEVARAAEAGAGAARATETAATTARGTEATTEAARATESTAAASNLKVRARGTIGDTVFEDTNQMARVGGSADEPTLIADRVSTREAKNKKVLPNGNMATAHAEVGVIQQAFKAGKTMGADMKLIVEGKPVCGHCLGDIPAMAEKAGLKSLTVVEEATGKTLRWEPGMRSLKAAE